MRGMRLAAVLALACSGLAMESSLAMAQEKLALRGTQTQRQIDNRLIGDDTLRSDPMRTVPDNNAGYTTTDVGNPGDADGIHPVLRTTLGSASDSQSEPVDQDPFTAANNQVADSQSTSTTTGTDTQQGSNISPNATSGTSSIDDFSGDANSNDTGTNSGDDAAATSRKTRQPAPNADAGQSTEVTGTIPARSVTEDDLERNSREQRTNRREQAIEGLRRKPEEDPYAPLGLRAGTFILRPSLETGITATTNANSSHGGKGAALSESTLRLNATSDASDYTATIDAFGTYRGSISGQHVSEPSAGINASLDVPLGNDFVARGTLGYSLTPESPSSPGFISGTEGEPLTQSLTGSLGLEKQAGKFRFGLTGNVERLTYGDAKLQGGGTVSQHERDSTLVSATLRAGYEISPALAPFVEGEIGRRYYDLKTDSAGYQRSSDRIGIRAGLALDLGEKLRGELSAGYLRETPDDPRLPVIDGPSINADLNWSPIRGTTVTLSGLTVVEGTTTAGESGDLLYTADLSIERQMRADLTGTASIGGLFRDYSGTSGHDLGWNAELGLTYWLNRYFGITGRLRHEEMVSNLPERDYKTESVFLGVKLQR